jgi:hypothetical protein
LAVVDEGFSIKSTEEFIRRLDDEIASLKEVKAPKSQQQIMGAGEVIGPPEDIQ